jgi:hypothetical protein
MSDTSWKITVEYDGEKYEFFGVYLDENSNTYCYCDHVNMVTHGDTREAALELMRKNALLLLRSYTAGEASIKDALSKQILWKARD